MTTSPPFSLRLAETSDEDFLYEIFVASRERELGPLPPEVRDTLAKQQYQFHRNGLKTEYPDAEQFVMLAPAGSTDVETGPVGMIILADRPDALWVVDMALHPDRRNAGLGAAVLQSLMDRCRSSGKIMRGSVTPYNPARRLYARLGVKEIGQERGYISLEWRPD